MTDPQGYGKITGELVRIRVAPTVRHGAELLVQVEDARVDQEGKGPKDHKGRVASSRPWSPVGAGTRDGPVGGQGLRQPTVSAAKSHLWSACILVHPPER